MPTIALVTTQAARPTDEDLAPLERALKAGGAKVSIVDWDDPAIDWSTFDLTVLRSCWDYTDRIVEFLAWVGHASLLTRLLNPLDVIRWNTDKHYLAELAKRDIAIVPSHFVEPGDNPSGALQAFLGQHADCAELVVKPAIGAGSRDTQRHGRGRHDAATDHIRRLLVDGRSAVLQPYLDRVDEAGETALVYFDGHFSHAIRKGPLLRRDEGPTMELYATEQIEPRLASAEEHELAARILAALPFTATPAYARVDLIRDGSGAPVLLELEMTEPSLFFDHAAGSAERFAACLLARCASLHPR